MATLALLRPLTIRDFRFLWTGMAVSLIGDGVFFVALAWQVYLLSDSQSALAAVGVAYTIPLVGFLLVGGIVSDRFDRRKVMIFGDVVRGVAVAGMAALSIAGVIELWHVVGLAVLFGVGEAFFAPAFGAVVPDIVPPHLILEANALDYFVRPIGLTLIGPAAGGLVIDAWGPGAAFGFDAVSFFFSASMLLAMTPRPLERDAAEAGAWQQTKEGFAFVRSQPWLWGTLSAAALYLLVAYGPDEVVLPHIVKFQLGGDAGDLGLVLAAGGIGAVLAAAVLGQRGLPKRHVLVMYLFWIVGGAVLAGYAFVTNLGQAAAIRFVSEAGAAGGMVVWATMMHRLVPQEMRGRVSSFDWFISVSLLPLSFAITGPVAAAIGDDATMIIAGVGGALVTLAFLAVPGMRATEGKLQLEPEFSPTGPSGGSGVGP
jgi:MFS family permease